MFEKSGAIVKQNPSKRKNTSDTQLHKDSSIFFSKYNGTSPFGHLSITDSSLGPCETEIHIKPTSLKRTPL